MKNLYAVLLVHGWNPETELIGICNSKVKAQNMIKYYKEIQAEICNDKNTSIFIKRIILNQITKYSKFDDESSVEFNSDFNSDSD